MTVKTHRVLPVAAGLALLAWSGLCSQSVAQTTSPNRIVMKDFMFQPMSLTVKAGSTVTWTNLDEEPHTVVSGQFRSNALDTKDSFSFKFDKPGTYSFVCSIHPQMMGTIIVQ